MRLRGRVAPEFAEHDTAIVEGVGMVGLQPQRQLVARERLLQAGKRLFGERGFHEVSIHEITDAAGLESVVAACTAAGIPCRVMRRESTVDPRTLVQTAAE